MPPPISDDERSDTSESLEVPKQRGRKPASKPESEAEPEDDVDNQGDVNDIPSVNPKTKNGDEEKDGEDDDDDEEEEEELEEDEFVVEKILQHVVEDGKLMFQVKWEGWDNPEDITYEPEENLVGSAEVILNTYYKSVGGREKVMQEIEEAQERIKEQKKRKRGRASTGADTKRARKTTNGHPRDTTPPTGFSEKNGVFTPPSGSWEDYIETVDASQDESSGRLMVYLTWKNGQKTCHDTKTVYKRCPQQMLRFYENHIKIVTHETAENDDLQNNRQEPTEGVQGEETAL